MLHHSVYETDATDATRPIDSIDAMGGCENRRRAACGTKRESARTGRSAARAILPERSTQKRFCPHAGNAEQGCLFCFIATMALVGHKATHALQRAPDIDAFHSTRALPSILLFAQGLSPGAIPAAPHTHALLRTRMGRREVWVRVII
ncbi:hypothetical protein M433DRAFT_4390 [Acidomyces richmondensis BFW]|nr:MAG: hypothetical protein FE78DRAFT_258627 [Acidomyces sp. 'richmondensis']KYG45678.1 hypothetical protein M433DRAFT_4390 [Acidomyces richmondensis BFW]